MGIISKRSNKTSFVLLETLTALTITVSCIYLVSFGNQFLLQAEKQSNQEILLIRKLYEDVKTYRIYQKLPERGTESSPSDTKIKASNGKIQKVEISQGEAIIEITKK